MYSKKILMAALLCCSILLSGCAAKEAEPSPSPTESIEPAVDYSGKLIINELMIKNRSTLQNAAGAFSDWVEIKNLSAENVELEGWSLSDKEDDAGWAFPQHSISPGEVLLIHMDELNTEGELHADFALSKEETVYLISPDGKCADSVLCPDMDADLSLVRAEDSSFVQCSWPSPGFENSNEGYDSYAAQHLSTSPIIINEVAVYCGEDEFDWVEIKNVSQDPVSLEAFYLSDDEDDYTRWQLPARVLGAGELFVIYCAGEEADSLNDLHADFSIGADRERLFLYSEAMGVMDYVSLHDIPLFGSMGRMPGENGFFYFETVSPAYENAGGMRRISESPIALSKDGIFEDISSVTVELNGNGTIHYTIDGSYPTAASAVYTGPITVDKTCVVRAISVEDGAIPGRPLTLSYIINEGHSLPVISLVADDITKFNDTYNSMLKDVNVPAHVAFYDNGGGFSMDCFTSLKGWTSLTLPKKSLGVEFKSVLGGNLEYDVFGNGISTYSDLAIRAGQDYISAIIRNELFQELCYDMEGPLLNQESRYSILYINGEYRGLYCLKEDFSKQYYASHTGVTKDSVEFFRAPSGPEVDFFNDVFMYCWHQDMSLPENYEFVCSKVDIDSLIDWFIIEGYSGNTDTQGNLRLFRSPENNNKWTFAFYDIDWGFVNPYNCYTLLIQGGGNVGGEMPTILWGLLNNADFKEQLIARYAEVYNTVLSNQHVLEKIDELAAIVEPEVARDRERWGLELEKWYEEVEALRRFVIDNDYEQLCLDNFCRNVGVSDEQRAQYFGQ